MNSHGQPTTGDTDRSARACIENVLASGCHAGLDGGSPLYTIIDLASRLEQDARTAGKVWVIRGNRRQNADSVLSDDSLSDDRTKDVISAWPAWFARHQNNREKPLLYLLSASTSAQLCARTGESAQRGIFCNDIESLPSHWPKGTQPSVPLWLSSNPLCVPFDPASGAEARAIMLGALQALYIERRPGFYYLALHDEPPVETSRLPESWSEDAHKGMYLIEGCPAHEHTADVRLLGAGRMLHEVRAAARLLEDDWGISAQVWSCPSYTRLARDAARAARWNRLHPTDPKHISHLQHCLGQTSRPVIAVTGYPQAVADQLGEFIAARFVALGADSLDVTTPAIRARHNVDRYWITALALKAVADEQQLAYSVVESAMSRYALA